MRFAVFGSPGVSASSVARAFGLEPSHANVKLIPWPSGEMPISRQNAEFIMLGNGGWIRLGMRVSFEEYSDLSACMDCIGAECQGGPLSNPCNTMRQLTFARLERHRRGAGI